MRQRNDSGHVVDVAAFPDEDHPEDHPFRVGPGEVVDFHDLIGGLTPLEDEPEPEPERTPAKSRKRPEAATAQEGVDQ